MKPTVTGSRSLLTTSLHLHTYAHAFMHLSNYTDRQTNSQTGKWINSF